MSDDRERKGFARLKGDRICVQTWDATTEAARWDLVFQQGATITINWEWLDGDGAVRDLTGYTADMHIRKHPDDAAATVDLGASLSIANDLITLTVTAATSAAWTFVRGVYDLKMTSSGGVVTRLVGGVVDLSKAVTYD